MTLMTQQLASDIDMAEESELRRLEGAPPSFPSVRVLSGGSRPIRVGNDGGDQTANGVREATASPVRVVMASAAMSEQAGPRLASLAMSAKSGRVRGLSITER